MENQLVVLQSHVYRPVILDFERKCWSAPGDMNVFRFHGNAEFVRFLSDIDPESLRALSIRYSEHYFLANKIVELESRVVSGTILCPGKEKRNQDE